MHAPLVLAAPFQPAEMLRVPLHELCLQIKLLDLGARLQGLVSRLIETRQEAGSE